MPRNRRRISSSRLLSSLTSRSSKVCCRPPWTQIWKTQLSARTGSSTDPCSPHLSAAMLRPCVCCWMPESWEHEATNRAKVTLTMMWFSGLLRSRHEVLGSLVKQRTPQKRVPVHGSLQKNLRDTYKADPQNSRLPLSYTEIQEGTPLTP